MTRITEIFFYQNIVDDYIGTQFIFESGEQDSLEGGVCFWKKVNDNNGNKKASESMVKYLKNISFVA